MAGAVWKTSWARGQFPIKRHVQDECQWQSKGSRCWKGHLTCILGKCEDNSGSKVRVFLTEFNTMLLCVTIQIELGT